jgi:hypothetical protein
MMSYDVNDKQVNSTQKCCKIFSTKKLAHTNSYEDKKISWVAIITLLCSEKLWWAKFEHIT